MKFLFIMTVAVLLPFNLVTAAWADSTQTSQQNALEQPPPESFESTQAEQIEAISVEQDPELVSPSERSSRLNNEAQQINQSLSTPQNPNRAIREILNLPDGMIIRGSSRGGIGIGTEY